MKKFFLLLLFLMLAVQLPSAATVAVQEPVASKLSEGGMVDLGTVGPGQKIEVQISRRTGESDYRGSEYLWDRLYVEDKSLPGDWTSVDSLYYETLMKAFVIVPKDAPDGDYVFSLRTERDYAGVETTRFKAKVHVSKDVLVFTITNPAAESGVGQPAVYLVGIKNTGNANDAFEVGVTDGLPRQWTYTKSVFVPRNSEKIVPYEVVATSHGQFPIKLKATSLSSGLIESTASAVLVSRSSLLEEAKAASRGVILFPAAEQVIYNLVGFVAANFFK